MISQVSQLFGQDSTFSWILQLVFTVFFIAFMFYGQRIQLYIMLRDVESRLARLKFIRDGGRKMAIKTIREVGRSEEDPTES